MSVELVKRSAAFQDGFDTINLFEGLGKLVNSGAATEDFSTVSVNSQNHEILNTSFPVETYIAGHQLHWHPLQLLR